MEKLSLHCKIRAGQTFKKPLDEYASGDLAVLLPKDVFEGKFGTDVIRIKSTEVPSLSNHLLKNGEIIIANKGSKFNTHLYDGNPLKAIATTAFYVITTAQSLLPGYLNWYLNQPEVKNYFLINAKGSVIPAINKDILGDLLIPLIPLKEQYYILDFIQQMTAERDLLKELLEKREEFARSFILEQIERYKL